MVSKTILTRVDETLEPIVEQSFGHPQCFHLLISSLWSLVQPLVDHNNHLQLIVTSHYHMVSSTSILHIPFHILYFKLKLSLSLHGHFEFEGDKKYQFIIWLYTTCTLKISLKRKWKASLRLIFSLEKRRLSLHEVIKSWRMSTTLGSAPVKGRAKSINIGIRSLQAMEAPSKTNLWVKYQEPTTRLLS